MAKNLGSVAAEHAACMDTAIIDLKSGTPIAYTFSDIDRLSGGVAHYLSSMGLNKGSRIGILSQNCASYLAAYFGIMRAGYVAVPISTKLRPDTVRFICDDSDIALLFCDRHGRSLVPMGSRIVDFDTSGSDGFEIVVSGSRFESIEIHAQDTAEILYTSGSTGVPKGVPLSHGGRLWALDALRHDQTQEPSKQIIAQPLFHMNGLVTATLALSKRDCIILQPRFETKAYVAAIEQFRVDSVPAIPTMWARALHEFEAGHSDGTGISSVILGSAPATQNLLARTRQLLPNASVRISYGTTEAGPVVFGTHPDGISTPPTALGYPVPGSEVELVDGPSENSGVLLMRNPAVMASYINMPEKTAKVLKDGWYYSGDIMYRDDAGFFYFVGRADEMFVCSGENVYPREVESLLERHPLIHQAAVVPLADEERGQVPVAFIVPRAGSVVSAEMVKAFALSNGPPHLHPRRVYIQKEIPMAGTNKIDRSLLGRQAKESELNDAGL